jgi:hypothetical protein
MLACASCTQQTLLPPGLRCNGHPGTSWLAGPPKARQTAYAAARCTSGSVRLDWLVCHWPWCTCHTADAEQRSEQRCTARHCS